MRPSRAFLLAAVPMLAFISLARAEHHVMDDKALMADLNGAAPAHIIAHATIMNMGADGKMKVIQEGTNGWTCMDPGGEPMCADKGAMDWVSAWQSKGPTPPRLGFVYMLKGDHGASNTDPYATKQTPDNNWIRTGPHVMIMGGEAKSMLDAYPREPKPDNTKPYVMWAGTPYEHLMMPVR
jgi:hypothetical protein